MLIISAGMQKSGSGWLFNLINDLLIASGFDDVRSLKDKYHLDSVLQYYNCNIGCLTKENLLPALSLSSNKHTFVVKTHEGPGDYLGSIFDEHPIRTTYIFRDPRAVALSAFDHGIKLRRSGESGSFSEIYTFHDSINFASGLFKIWKAWTDFPGTFIVKYEDLVNDTQKALIMLANHLVLNMKSDQISEIITSNLPGVRKGTHFNVGDATRYLRVWTPEQLKYANDVLGEMILRMGYPI